MLAMVVANSVEYLAVLSYEGYEGSCSMMVAARAWAARDDPCSSWNTQNIVVIESQKHMLCIEF